MLRLDKQHEENRGRRPRPGPEPSPDAHDSEQSAADSFRRAYDVFIFLALALSVLEALMLRLGRRRLADAEARRKERGTRSLLSTDALESLLDEEDVRRAGYEGWPGESVQQVCLRSIAFLLEIENMVKFCFLFS